MARWMLILLVMWVFVTTMLQRLQCPKMTCTELLLNIPDSAIGQFAICNFQ